MLVNPFMLNPLDVTPHIGVGNRMIILETKAFHFCFLIYDYTIQWTLMKPSFMNTKSGVPMPRKRTTVVPDHDKT